MWSSARLASTDHRWFAYWQIIKETPLRRGLLFCTVCLFKEGCRGEWFSRYQSQAALTLALSRRERESSEVCLKDHGSVFAPFSPCGRRVGDEGLPQCQHHADLAIPVAGAAKGAGQVFKAQ